MYTTQKGFLFLIILCVFPALLFAQRAGDIIGDTFEETSGKGFVIRTNPAGVKVFIDGMERGLSPLTLENLPSGEHSVKLYKEGYKERQFSVTLFNNSRLVVSIQMKEENGNVLVSVRKAPDSPEQLPFLPHVFSGAQYASALSADNTAVLNLPAGYRTIKARAFGWEDADVTVLVDERNPVNADIYMRPAEFKFKNTSASRRRFNPKISGSLGSVVCRFEVTAPGSGTFTVLDKNGNPVFQENLAPFVTWEQSVTWNGRDSYGNFPPEGVYKILIEASGQESVSVSLETEINYSISIFPLSLSSGLSGLVFSPLPNVLPAGSFQIEGSIFAGNFNGEKIFSVLPFTAGIRVSPFNRLEISSVFNINPHFSAKAGWGVSGSAKFNILNGNGFPLAFAGGFSYSWADENGNAPLNSGKGIGIYAPLSLELEKVSLAFSPGAFWRGPSGSIPELLLSTGILYRGGRFSAGVSARAEFDFAGNALNPKILAGTEWRYSPMLSNMVFLCQFGMWTQNGNTGGYGGMGIGVIY
ncbi:MAG: PEGA domain-containing protein [Treponema sp.]|nr:PEGA domain-containing protein [Treponema sp.]